MLCVQRALQLAQIEGWTQPPLTLVMMESELNAALFGAPVDNATLPEWSQAPQAAFRRPDKEVSGQIDPSEIPAELRPASGAK